MYPQQIHPKARWLALVLLALLPLSALATAFAQTPVETGFIRGIATLDDRQMPYVVYVPRDYSPDKQWPVILALHGAGESAGRDGLRPMAVGIGAQVIWNSSRFPCLVVMPQTADSWSGRYADLAVRALDDVVAKYHGDPSRLYVTGLSMGGNGTWVVASKYPERFAAAIPICGWGNPASMAPKLNSMPIWVFHGDMDSVVSVSNSRKMVEAIQAAGNPNIKYTEYKGVDHNAWDRTYQNSQVIAWLLAQKR